MLILNRILNSKYVSLMTTRKCELKCSLELDGIDPFDMEVEGKVSKTKILLH